MKRLLPIWPPIASALLLLAAFPPFNLSLLVFVALAPWFASLHDRNGRQAFGSGYVFGLVFMGGQFVWLFQFVNRWLGNPWLSLLPTVVATLIAALYFGWTGWLIQRAWAAKAPWAIPFAWTAVEVVRSFIPALAFPWGLLHTPLWLYPELIQLAWYGTAYLVTLALAFVNITIALFLLQRPWGEIRRFAFPITVVFLGAAFRTSTPVAGKPVYVTVGQPGVDMAFNTPEEERRQLREAIPWIFDLARMHGSTLTVLPEGLVTGGDRLPPQTDFEVPSDLPVLFGGSRGTSPRYQSAYSFDGEWDYADKRRLVIFGEYVPFRDQLPFLSSFRLPSGDLVPSDRTKAVRVAGMTVGPLLCFEGLFADVARDQAANGAQLLAVMSIDDWYMGTGAPDQLMAGTIFRAVETGLPTVRSASKGHTLAVGPRGHLLAHAPLGERRALRVDLLIPERAEVFPAAWVMPWFSGLAAVWIPALAFWRLRKATPESLESPGRSDRPKSK